MPYGFVVAGSSPLMWGTPGRPRSSALTPRFIPAHVGNTVSFPSIHPLITVHPRSRGEHAERMEEVLSGAGSSPLTWGTPRRRRHGAPDRRFIPAHVGNTPPLHPAASGPAVHPRSRGEHCGGASLMGGRYGSSPLTWGTRLGRLRRRRSDRFIPAHVGNTIAARSAPSSMPVHPRSRGEHLDGHPAYVVECGSSPLTWGTPESANWRRSYITVHPRSRGEHVTITPGTLNADGSSPLTWGTRPLMKRRHYLRRFIPAHVGNTSNRDRRPVFYPVHPRSRGEHCSAAQVPIVQAGSSPLTWGTHVDGLETTVNTRFIPAHVGNTAGQGSTRPYAAVHPRSRGEHLQFFR